MENAKDGKIKDPRFSRISRDPRFRNIKKNVYKAKIDRRFSEMFEDEDFRGYSDIHIDKYGRKVKDQDRKRLLKFYELDEEEYEEQRDSQSEKSTVEDLSESSDEDITENEEIEDSYRWENPTIKDSEVVMGDSSKRLALVNMDWDNITIQDIYFTLNSFKPDMGSIKSVDVYISDFGRKKTEEEKVFGPPKDVLDDISGEKISEDGYDDDLNVPSDTLEEKNIYEAEELMKDENNIDINYEYDGNNNILRNYQLERLKYYYAVIETDDKNTAQTIYNECDGKEFEISCCCMDLRYVQDDVEFSDSNLILRLIPKFEHNLNHFYNRALSSLFSQIDMSSLDSRTVYLDPNYVQNGFINRALQHSKVSLTWDADDPLRSRITRRRFREEDLDKIDFDQFVASNSEDEYEENKEVTINVIHNTADKNVFDANKKKKMSKEIEVVFDAGFETEDSDNDLSKYKKRDRQGKLRRDVGDSLEKERLKLLIEDDGESTKNKHFYFKDIIKSEKRKHKMDAPDDFEINLEDERFSDVFTSHLYAIDPNNPSFKNTKSMKKVLDKKLKTKKEISEFA